MNSSSDVNRKIIIIYVQFLVLNQTALTGLLQVSNFYN